MAAVYEAGFCGGAAFSCCWRVLCLGLFVSCTREGMLLNWLQLDMGEAKLCNVGDKAIGQTIPAQNTGGGAGRPHPGRCMHLINGDRRSHRLSCDARLHPVSIGPGKIWARCDN